MILSGHDSVIGLCSFCLTSLLLLDNAGAKPRHNPNMNWPQKIAARPAATKTVPGERLAQRRRGAEKDEEETPCLVFSASLRAKKSLRECVILTDCSAARPAATEEAFEQEQTEGTESRFRNGILRCLLPPVRNSGCVFSPIIFYFFNLHWVTFAFSSLHLPSLERLPKRGLGRFLPFRPRRLGRLEPGAASAVACGYGETSGRGEIDCAYVSHALRVNHSF